MNYSSAARFGILTLLGLGVGVVLGQVVLGEGVAPTTSSPTASTPSPRKLAPGVMESVLPEPKREETVSYHDVVELLAIDQDFKFAKEVAFYREVWYLDFKFKPLRMIHVDIPQPTGKMLRKQILYLLYSVTNPGKVMVPVPAASPPIRPPENQQLWDVQYVDKPVRFIPRFLLETQDRLEEGTGQARVQRDKVLPLAVAAIQMREDRHRRLYNTVEMCRPIAVGETLWGVATWDEFDPRAVRFSVYVQGLTNAYRWEDAAGAYQPGDYVGKGRKLSQKTLRLNFWRPGDENLVSEEQFRYGIPRSLVPDAVDYAWVYR